MAIRSEEDAKVLKHFTPEQRRLRSEWRRRSAQAKSPEEVSSFLGQMQAMFARMAGKGSEV